MKFFEEFKVQKICEIKSALKKVSGLVEITFGLVKASISWSEWQAVKLTFFASWMCCIWLHCIYVKYVNVFIVGSPGQATYSATKFAIQVCCLKIDLPS